ncbi:LPXTG cell wall anchor domain-containing protein, partial [Streptococcus agalactiae]|nr:LPXTG cell wall anchor domain-containing protein [Streptococcus agalactiae]
VEADGGVNPEEKSAVDGLNDVTTEKKGTATPLVDSLPEGPVAEVELPSTGEINTHLSLFGIIVLLISTLMYGSKKKED